MIKIWDKDKTLLREIIMNETLTVASFLNYQGKNFVFTELFQFMFLNIFSHLGIFSCRSLHQQVSVALNQC